MTGWTDEQVVTLRRMRTANATNKQTADALGKTVDAVIRKARALGMPKRRPGRRGVHPAKAATPNPCGKKSFKRIQLPEGVKKRLANAERGQHVAIEDLTPKSCRWPLADETYCGETKRDGASYCAFHCDVAYINQKKDKTNDLP